MAEAATKGGDEKGGKAPIDREHLARMTFGDKALERELLELFDRQAALLVARMRDTDAASVAALAHTLKGSALGIGASEVAAMAAEVEQHQDPERLSALGRSVERVRTAIAAMLAPRAN